MFGGAAITLGIGPHSSYLTFNVTSEQNNNECSCIPIQYKTILRDTHFYQNSRSVTFRPLFHDLLLPSYLYSNECGVQ